MLESAVLSSEFTDAKKASKEILEKLKKLNKVPRACILLCHVDMEHSHLLNSICDAYPNIVLMGGTTDGEMANGEFYDGSAVATFIFADEKIGLDLLTLKDLTTQNAKEKTKEELLKKAKSLQYPLKVVYCLPDGVAVDNGAVVNGANDAIKELKADAIVAGGATGDAFRFSKCYEFAQREVLTGAVSMLLFSGDVHGASSYASGWTPIGDTATVTKSEGNIVHEINGISAVEYFKKYIGGGKEVTGTDIVSFPLACYVDETHYYMRAVMVVDGTKLVCAGTVPQGITVRLSKATKDGIIDSVRNCCNAVKDKLNFKPSLAILASCTTRKQFLGTEVAREATCVLETIGNIQLTGFYAYGELSPMKDKNFSFFHNNTITLLVVG